MTLIIGFAAGGSQTRLSAQDISGSVTSKDTAGKYTVLVTNGEGKTSGKATSKAATLKEVELQMAPASLPAGTWVYVKGYRTEKSDNYSVTAVMKVLDGGKMKWESDLSGGIDAEGIEALKEVSGSVDKVLANLAGGVQSGLGYQGASDLAELRQRARYICVSAAGQREASPHDVVEVKTSASS